MYKSLEEVESVIALSKPIEVINLFIASYLQGLAYEAWRVDKDLEATEEVIVGKDEEDNDIIETRLVNVYEEVEVNVSAWKIENFALLRASSYPPMEMFADAWVKNDENGMEAYRQMCLEVKAKYPK